MAFSIVVTCLLPIIAHAGVLSPAFSENTGISAATFVKRTTATVDYGITSEELEHAVRFAYVTANLSQRLEANIRDHVAIERGSPAFGLAVAFGPDAQAMERGRTALIATKATVQLANKFCMDYRLNYDDCFAAIRNCSIKDSSLRSFYDRFDKVCTSEENQHMYRSPDGSCNNVRVGDLGESFTGYSRLLPPDYSNNINVVRRARNKHALPNARKVSSTIIDNDEVLNDRLTLAVSQWGQFLEHDLSRFASSMMYHYNSTFDCCDKDGRNLAPRYHHPLCMAIEVPSDDEYYSANGLRCMSYARSLPAVPRDHHFGWINQLNQATHFLDGSQIYGTTREKTSQLRSHTNGMLKVERMGDRTYLQRSEQPTEDCQVKTKDSPCFVSGDPRVNQHPHLAAMHTLWAREHNRVAGELSAANELWDDETLFQEARRIVVAEMQHITYDDWLPKVLGGAEIEMMDGEKKYEETVDATVSNSFATAAIRSLHSMFSDQIRLVGEDRENDDSPPKRLGAHFNNPGIILKNGVFDSLVRGLASQASGNVDIHYAADLTTKLFADQGFGYDTMSLDIQRGRDHGLPSYNAYRKHCGLASIEEFKDEETIREIERLSRAYNDPDDVDLIVGGLMETPLPGNLVGPTFACLIQDQLIRTRQGDRYFYTNVDQPKPFSLAQLQEIRKVTLARIFCDNSDEIKTMQPDVFVKISSSNDLVDCNSDTIPRMDFMPWHDTREKYDFQ